MNILREANARSAPNSDQRRRSWAPVERASTSVVDAIPSPGVRHRVQRDEIPPSVSTAPEVPRHSP
jgi:hypothetical protein